MKQLNIKYFLLGLLIGIIIVGCFTKNGDTTCIGNDGIHHLTIDPSSFSQEERGHIYNAAQRWNILAKVKLIKIDDGDGDGSGKCVIRDLGMPSPDYAWDAMEYPSTGDIVVSGVWKCEGNQPEGRDGICFEAIILHEMGHMLGMVHLPPGVDGIMRGTGGCSIYFTQADLDQCLAINVCK